MKRSRRLKNLAKRKKGVYCQCGTIFYPWSTHSRQTYVKKGKGGRARMHNGNTRPVVVKGVRPDGREFTYRFQERIWDANLTVRLYWPDAGGRYVACPKCSARYKDDRRKSPPQVVFPRSPRNPAKHRARILRHRDHQSKARR